VYTTGEKQMKKILCLIAAMLLVATAAQAKDIDAGTVEVAGAATIGYQSTDLEVKDGGTTDQAAWTVVLNSNYYFMPNLGAGLVLEYSSLEIDDMDRKTTEIGPALVYNFSMNEQVSLPLFGAITYASMDETDIDKYSGWGWKIGTGVKYFMADNVSLNGTVDYGQQYLTHDVLPDLDVKGFSVMGGLSVYFGGM